MGYWPAKFIKRRVSKSSNLWLYPLLLTVLLNAIGYGMIGPVLPDLLVEISGNSAIESAGYAGRLFFIYALFQFLCLPFFGYLSDRIGRRPVILFAVSAIMLDYIVMATTQSLTVLYIGRAIAGAFGAASIMSRAYVSDLFKGDDRAKYFGYIGVCLATGILMGPALGGAAAEISTRMPFILSALLSALNLVLALLFLKESHQPSGHQEAFKWQKVNPFGFFKRLFQKNSLRPFIVVYALIILAYTAYLTVFSFVTMEKFNWTPLDYGLCLMTYGIAGLIGQAFLIERAVKKLGLDRAIFYGAITYAIGFFLIGFATHPIWVYLGVPVAAISGIFSATVITKISKLVPQNIQGEIQGILGSASGLMLMIGPIVMAETFTYSALSHWPVSQSIKTGAPFILGGLISLGCLVIVAKNIKPQAA